jgi:hypothetical protein
VVQVVVDNTQVLLVVLVTLQIHLLVKVIMVELVEVMVVIEEEEVVVVQVQ